jgi:isocitrate dehydrogenase
LREKTDLLTRAKNDLAKEEALRLGRETMHKSEIAVKDNNHMESIQKMRSQLEKEIQSRQDEVYLSKKNHLAESE